MKIHGIIVLLVLGIGIFSNCRKPGVFPEEEYDAQLSGGRQTNFDNTSQAFSIPFEGLSSEQFDQHMLGDAAFEQTFVAAPSMVNNGLGPAFNNVSCVSCHHNDGIGVPTAGDPQSGLLIRISSPGTDAHGGPLAFSGYGTQVQDKAIFGKIPEATISISYSTQTYTLPDGGSYELRTPSYSLLNMYLPQSGYLLSPRLAPPVFGLGLLDAIPESDILLHADATDQNQDGISGKANWVWDPHQKKNMLGRFGLKCNTATLHTQVAAAYNHDMGITNPVFPEETIQGQTQMDGLSDDPELSAEILDAAVFYVRTLQVPSRRLVSDSKAQRGEKLFLEAGCEKCHTSTFYTRVDVGFPALSHQRIHPYSDLLLHDMGEGLADHRDDYQADGREWRTKPLWGLGLIEKVNYPGYYLHDGRARSMLEAVMWHDGEAKTSTDFVKQLSKADREALLFFLKSL